MSDSESDDEVVGGAVEEVDQTTPMDQILIWIGFTDAQRPRLLDEFETFEDLREWRDKDVSELAESFAKRTQAEGKMHFGMARTKRLKALIHWIQDFGRVSREPTIDGLDQASFRAALQVAAQRSLIRTQEAEHTDTISREAAPGKLKDERQYVDWKNRFRNMLSSIQGVSGIPLSYVIRDNDEPIHEGHDTFIQECIACAPLSGVAFEADARQVHHLATASVQGETSEQWIKHLKRHQNGRRDVQALSDHFQGEGNTSRRIAEAERIRDTLHYKSERALPFATFLAKLQLMFNIFLENDEPYSEAMKVRALFDKVQHPQLATAVSALKVQSTMDQNAVTFTTASNHLAAEVSQMPEYAANKRGISATGTTGSTEGIYRDGKIFTGYYPNWMSGLSQEDRDKVIAERKRLGVKGPRRKGKGRASAAKTKKKIAAVVKDLEKAKRSIAALKRKGPSSGETNAGDTDDDSPDEDAGDAFGGRSERKNKKKKSS